MPGACVTLPPMAPLLPHRAIILAVGTELTTGETRDTNGGDLASDLSRMGVAVVRMVQLPDDLALVTAAFREALADADLVVSTGGLGPTPDDLTREAIAAALGEPLAVDPDLERQLIALFERRGVRMPDANRKQAWLIPGAEALPNVNGTAPGWWVERGDRIIVALPGPPRELRPLWATLVLPRLRTRGLGTEIAVRTLRLTGIGESHVVEVLGEALLRATNPLVATYARPDAVDLRITARPEPGRDGLPGRPAAAVLAEAQRVIEERLGPHIFAYDDETWPEALGRRLGTRRVATWERGTAGALVALLAGAPWYALGEVVGPAGPGAAHDTDDLGAPLTAAGQRRAVAARQTAQHATTPLPDEAAPLHAFAQAIRQRVAAEVGLALAATRRGEDTLVRVSVDLDGVLVEGEEAVFLGVEQGRRRAALAACAALWRALDQVRQAG